MGAGWSSRCRRELVCHGVDSQRGLCRWSGTQSLGNEFAQVVGDGQLQEQEGGSTEQRSTDQEPLRLFFCRPRTASSSPQPEPSHDQRHRGETQQKYDPYPNALNPRSLWRFRAVPHLGECNARERQDTQAKRYLSQEPDPIESPCALKWKCQANEKPKRRRYSRQIAQQASQVVVECANSRKSTQRHNGKS